MTSPIPRIDFATTRWSLVAASERRDTHGQAALSDLCRVYWQPLYAFLRRSGSDRQTAEDLTQGFLADLLERGDLAIATPERGRFRTFLLAALKHYAAKQRAHDQAIKRGGQVTTFSFDFAGAEAAYQFEPTDTRTADEVFDRQWALALLASVLEQLETRYRESDRADWFAAMRSTITTGTAAPYTEIASALGTTPGAVKTAVGRLRREYRHILDATLADGVDDDADLIDERRTLFAALAR